VITYQARVRTPWSVDKAFAYMSDLSNFEEWDPGTKSARLVSGIPGTVGATYDVSVGLTTLRYVTEEVGDQHVRAVAESGLLRSIDTVTVEPDRDGSTVVYDAHLEPKGVLGLAEPLIGVMFRRIADKGARGLAAKLDGELLST
jgi:hypothetical protein